MIAIVRSIAESVTAWLRSWSRQDDLSLDSDHVDAELARDDYDAYGFGDH